MKNATDTSNFPLSIGLQASESVSCVIKWLSEKDFSGLSGVEFERL